MNIDLAILGAGGESLHDSAMRHVHRMMHGELAIAIAGGMTAKSIGHGRQPRALPCVTLLRRRRLSCPLNRNTAKVGGG